MLRAKYGESLFDLAKMESTTLLGKKAKFTKNGKSYDLLDRSYTDDGGHLNALGRQIMAIDLLLYLLSFEPD
jgi:lysophospholipase L1-like esterase